MRERGPSPASRSDLTGIPPYSPDAPASDLVGRAGVGRVAKLDANESPLGPFPGVAEAVADVIAAANRYPDRGQALVDAIARRHAVAADAVLVTNGADAAIGLLCDAFGGPGAEVVAAVPSFVTYAQDAVRSGARAVEVPVRADGCLDLPAMLAAIGPATRLVFLCNPNNPTGGVLPAPEVEAFLDAVPPGVVVAVDEAYAEYTGAEPDDVAPIGLARPNVCRLRTFSKIFGLANLRVGYVIGPPDLLEPLRRLRHWYDVSDAAHVAATVSLLQPEEIARRREANVAGRAQLEQVLRSAGLAPLSSAACFVLAPVDDAAGVAAALEQDGVLVRAVEAERRGYIRVAVGDADDHRQLGEALARRLTG